MKNFLLIVIAMIVLFSQISHSATVTLPVPQDVLTRVTLSIQKLQDLLKYFNTFYENKHLIYQRVQLTKKYLLELSKSLAQYNNIIAGSGNSVNGSKNIVIGNYDNIEGSNNWVFVSQFTGKINGDLLIGIWRIELDKSYLILVNTRFAISYLDQSKNTVMKNKYGSKTRRICKWDKWTHPENTKTDSYWKKYWGYNDWKNEYQKANTNNTNTLGNWGNWGSWDPEIGVGVLENEIIFWENVLLFVFIFLFIKSMRFQVIQNKIKQINYDQIKINFQPKLMSKYKKIKN